MVGAEKLGELAKRLKDVERERKLPRKLSTGIRNAAKPVVAHVQQEIRTLPVKGTRGGGARRRETYAYRRSSARALDRAEDKDLGSDELNQVLDRHRRRARQRSGLRDTIARSIKTEIKTGPKSAAVRIVVDEKQLPPDQRKLPRYLDSTKGWRKPTFGRDPWTVQKGRPWFASTIRKHAAELRTQILKVMDDIADEIERGL